MEEVCISGLKQKPNQRIIRRTGSEQISEIGLRHLSTNVILLQIACEGIE